MTRWCEGGGILKPVWSCLNGQGIWNSIVCTMSSRDSDSCLVGDSSNWIGIIRLLCTTWQGLGGTITCPFLSTTRISRIYMTTGTDVRLPLSALQSPAPSELFLLQSYDTEGSKRSSRPHWRNISFLLQSSELTCPTTKTCAERCSTDRCAWEREGNQCVMA